MEILADFYVDLGSADPACMGVEGCAGLADSSFSAGTCIQIGYRCLDHNRAGGADGQQEAGTVCFIKDVQSMEIAQDPEQVILEDGTAVLAGAEHA
jgi:hypothetical protein